MYILLTFSHYLFLFAFCSCKPTPAESCSKDAWMKVHESDRCTSTIYFVVILLYIFQTYLHCLSSFSIQANPVFSKEAWMKVQESDRRASTIYHVLILLYILQTCFLRLSFFVFYSHKPRHFKGRVKEEAGKWQAPLDKTHTHGQSSRTEGKGYWDSWSGLSVLCRENQAIKGDTEAYFDILFSKFITPDYKDNQTATHPEVLRGLSDCTPLHAPAVEEIGILGGGDPHTHCCLLLSVIPRESKRERGREVKGEGVLRRSVRALWWKVIPSSPYQQWRS